MASINEPLKRTLDLPLYRDKPRPIAFSAYTIWLFTQDDIKTTVLPSIGFALINSVVFRQLPLFVFVSRLPVLLLWIQLNLLAFNAHNQHHPGAIKEDRLNKPWRPLPSGRITPRAAKILGHVAYSLGVLISLLSGGGAIEASLLVALGYVYNDLGWSGHWAVRNLINALGITTFLGGALSAALRSPLSADMMPWLAIVAALIGTTVHTQDMQDQPGDAAAGRKTIPLVLGDGPTRWTIAVAVLFWSVVAPWYWASSTVGYLLMVGTGAAIAGRTLTKRSVAQDRTAFTLYNIWLVLVYSLPLTATR